ncbi:MAG: hypothetical protein Q9182_004270 [Xanthomendoza sp. 2 TL-2023]
MPFFDDPFPPRKERKNITTYGSQTMVSRTLRAIKDAVPTSIFSSPSRAAINPAARPDGPNDFPTTLRPSQNEINASHRGMDGPPRSLLNHVSDNGSGDDTDHLSHSQKKSSSLKRLRKNPASSHEEPARKKRRKAIAPDETEDDERHPAMRENLKEPRVNTLHNTAIREEKTNGENGLAEDEAEVNVAEGLPNDQPDGQISGAHTSTRPRRKPQKSPAQDGNCSQLNFTTPKSKNPKTSTTTTPSRKRGRPRKGPILTPTSHDIEESEMGFRKITPNQPLTARRPVRSERDDRMMLKGPRPANKKSAKSTKVQSEEDRQSHESADEKGTEDDLHQLSTPRSVVSRSETHTAKSRQPDPISDGSPEPLESDQTSGAIQKSTAKLQKLLRTCSQESLRLFKSDLLQNQTSKCSPLVNMDEEYRRAHQLVTQTVLAGEGNSMLLIGPRGCGKTTLVESVLSDLAVEHQDDFVVIRLSGFIHTDDKLALREIWRQLGREIAAEDDTTGIRTNYADTLTSLLALLAHSSEDEGNQDAIARSVIFVIDEFDLFASHPRQTLLYNLFDVAQSRNAPIAVLGLTTRIDVVESLEKRVKSRFGQRYIYLSHSKNFGSFQATCKSALTGRAVVAEQTFLGRLGKEKALIQQLRAAWNEYVDALFAHDSQFNKFLRHLHAQSNCVASFKSASYLPLTLLSATNIPTGASWITSSLLPPDSKLQLLPSLSDLELSLLIAAARLDIILDTNMCSFAMVYDEYVQLASRAKLQSNAAGQSAVGGGARVWGKDVARGAWERLMDLELVIGAGTGVRGSGGGGGGQMCRVDVALEEIGPSVAGMGATLVRWCREI